MYTEIAPCAALAPWVECYWSIGTRSAPAVPNRVLPDGCADIIVGVPGFRGPVAVGTMRAAEVFALPQGADLFGIRFRPGCARPFLGISLDEITDRRIPLDDISRGDMADLAHVAPNARVALADQMLSERLRRWPRNLPREEPLATHAVALLRRARGGATVRDVAIALGVGERRLQRAFDRTVGLGPKAFARVVRMRGVAGRIDAAVRANTPIAWTALAFDAGYADQSHMIREFAELAGLTPVAYAAERRGVGIVQYESASGT